MKLRYPLMLASASPRRRDLLEEAGVAFTVVPAASVEEAHDASLSPSALTQWNARMKAEAVAAECPEALVLGADTLVYLGQEPLGKPADMAEATAMISRLVGRTHIVCTGVCLVQPLSAGGQVEEFHILTEVTFKSLTPNEIAHYLSLINPLDKAGSYAAQEYGEMIIEKVEGSWSNVVGLPMEATLTALAAYTETGQGGWKP
jgi:septum formation protein